MRKRLWLLYLLGLLVLAVLATRVLALRSPSTSQVPTAGAQVEFQRVASVVDGDTIVLENGERVRYIGIDAPETSHPTHGKQCYGEEAAARNRELVEGKTVRLEKDQSDRDQYDRLLRYVYVCPQSGYVCPQSGCGDEVFVNAQLVAEGFAYASYFPPDRRHYQALLALELQAEQHHLGLWNVCHTP